MLALGAGLAGGARTLAATVPSGAYRGGGLPQPPSAVAFASAVEITHSHSAGEQIRVTHASMAGASSRYGGAAAS